MEEFLTGVALFQVITDIYDLCVGSALVYGALKWKKGLITTVACYWGIVIGCVIGLFTFDPIDMDSGTILVFILICGIIFPILTYHVPAINRFVVGFLVTMKLLYMLTTYLCKNGVMEFETAIIMPLVIATILGLIFAGWHQMSVLPFALACVFLGASQLAPTISKYINQILFGITQDYSLLFDPIDFIFALFKIELTDGWTLFFMIVLMCMGLPAQLNFIRQQGTRFDTPLIVFETNDPRMHGKIVSKE